MLSHYDHTTGTSVKGINSLTALYCTEAVSLPVAFALVEKGEEFTDPKMGQTKRRASVSKNEHYRSMLSACVKNGMPFRYGLNDVWFAAADNMKLIKTDLKKDFVMKKTSSCPSNPTARWRSHGRTKCSHLALGSRLYVAAVQLASDQLQRLQPGNLLA